MDRLCRLKLDLEAVVEDANEEVYSFQIKRSLIYLKFVGGCTYIIYYLGLIGRDMGCSGNGQDGQDQITAREGVRRDP